MAMGTLVTSLYGHSSTLYKQYIMQVRERVSPSCVFVNLQIRLLQLISISKSSFRCLCVFSFIWPTIRPEMIIGKDCMFALAEHWINLLLFCIGAQTKITIY